MRFLKIFLCCVLFVGSMSAQNAAKSVCNLRLKPVFSGKPLILGSYKYGTPKGDTVTIDRFRFYISAIQLFYSDGRTYTESNSYHLVDAEDNESLSFALKNTPVGQINAITFNIGVDSAASVSGALSGALDPVKGMYWAWNSGYINAKLEGTCKQKPGQKQNAFEFHIGGYLAPFYALRSVKLPLEKPMNAKNIEIACDAAVWLEEVDLRKENSVVIPGEEAMRVANRYAKMFSVMKR
jgi:hypothetical protein